MSANPYETGPFRHVGDMEEPLSTVADLLKGIAMIAETIGEDGTVVQRLAWLAIAQCKEAEKLRGELFHLTHPDRERFEREGWPS